MDEEAPKNSAKGLPCLSPTCHKFSCTLYETRIYFLATNLGKSIFLWIGTENGRMNDMTYSSITRYDKEGTPSTTQILGSGRCDGRSEAIAAQLTKKLKMPVYVSFNVEMGSNASVFVKGIEKRIFEELSSHPECFGYHEEVQSTKLSTETDNKNDDKTKT